MWQTTVSSELSNCEKIKTAATIYWGSEEKEEGKKGGKEDGRGKDMEGGRERDVLRHSMYYLLNYKNLQLLLIMYNLTC